MRDLLKSVEHGNTRLAVTAVAVLAVAGCGKNDLDDDGSERQPGKARGSIDEERGSYAGVRLRDPRRRVVAKLGRPRRNSSGPNPYAPGGNQNITLPADTEYSPVYPDADFSFYKGKVASFGVYGRGARTRRGARLGDPLSRIRTLYRASCHGEEDRGSEFGPIEAHCITKTAPGTYFYFGGDPVTTILVSSQPLYGGCEYLPVSDDPETVRRGEAAEKRCIEEGLTGKVPSWKR